MTEQKFVTNYKVYDLAELPEADRKLVDLAREATRSSYAPYSNFHVGAALRLDNGVLIKGANQENAAFAGICGERSACYNAGANYPGVPIQAIAVTAFTEGDFVKDPCSPCGVCRQALVEFETQAGKPMRVILAGRDKAYIVDSISALLPFTFTEF